MSTEILTCESALTPLDLLLWRRFRAEPDLRVESVLGLNPGLAETLFLKIGQKVECPQESTPKQKRQARPVISLFD